MNPIRKISRIISRRGKAKSSSPEELSKEITHLFVDILKTITQHTNTQTVHASSPGPNRIKRLISIIRDLLNKIKIKLKSLLLCMHITKPAFTLSGIALFIDNYDRIDHFLNPWLLDILSDDNCKALAGKVKLVIAGRRKLSYYATLPNPLVRLTFQYVKPWPENDAKNYLNNIADPQHRELILKLSGRLPRWLSVLSCEYPSIAQTSPNYAIFSRALVNRFLELCVEDPHQRQLILEVALARKFNFHLVVHQLGEQAAERTFNLLETLPFTESDPYGFYYFPRSIREPMLSLLLRSQNSDVQMWIEGHEKLARCYKKMLRKLLESLGLNLNINWNAIKWSSIWQYCSKSPIVQYYALEAVYHDLCHDLCKLRPVSFQAMRVDLFAAARASRNLGLILAHTISQAIHDTP